jgi:hypothetical protein
MTTRAFQETLVALAVTIALLFLGAGLLALDSAPAGDAFLRRGPAGLLAILGLPVLVWALVITASNLLSRRRGVAVKLTLNAVLTVAVAGFTAAFWAALAFEQGGFASLLIGVAIAHSLLFGVSALLALALTHLLVFRRAPLPTVRVA